MTNHRRGFRLTSFLRLAGYLIAGVPATTGLVMIYLGVIRLSLPSIAIGALSVLMAAFLSLVLPNEMRQLAERAPTPRSNSQGHPKKWLATPSHLNTGDGESRLGSPPFRSSRSSFSSRGQRTRVDFAQASRESPPSRSFSSCSFWSQSTRHSMSSWIAGSWCLRQGLSPGGSRSAARFEVALSSSLARSQA